MTPALQANLSFLSHPKDSYYVAVTAVVNGSESEPAPSDDGITFSYFHENLVGTKCECVCVCLCVYKDNIYLFLFVFICHIYMCVYIKNLYIERNIDLYKNK